MPWNGSGTFTRSNGFNTGTTVWTADKNAAVKITASRHDNHDNDLRDGINACLAKNGENAATANLPMAGFKHTNVAEASARTDYARYSQVQDGAPLWGGTSGGTANAQTLSLTPAITAYATGMAIRFIPGSANTGATTLAVNGLSTKNIYYMNKALVGGELQASVPATLIYDGTQWQLLNHGGGWATWTPTLSASGSLTFTSTSINKAVYQRHGTEVRFCLNVTGTTGGSTDIALQATLPIGADLTDAYALSCAIFDATYSGTFNSGGALITGGSSNTISARHYNNQNWGLGAARGFSVSGVYKTS